MVVLVKCSGVNECVIGYVWCVVEVMCINQGNVHNECTSKDLRDYRCTLIYYMHYSDGLSFHN